MMDSKFLEELRQRYMKNPPEGMTSKLVKNMTDSHDPLCPFDNLPF